MTRTINTENPSRYYKAKAVSTSIMLFMKRNKVSCIDATIAVCKALDISFENIRTYLSNEVRDRLQKEFSDKHMIKREYRVEVGV